MHASTSTGARRTARGPVRVSISIAALAVAFTGLASVPSMAASNTLAPSVTKTITLSQVKKHATAKSCWSAINGNVYDLTTWISRHPGGAQRIMSICGKDGTKAFGGKHGLTGSQAKLLAQFKIGKLAR